MATKTKAQLEADNAALEERLSRLEAGTRSPQSAATPKGPAFRVAIGKAKNGRENPYLMGPDPLRPSDDARWVNPITVVMVHQGIEALGQELLDWAYGEVAEQAQPKTTSGGNVGTVLIG
jgi:hypothetical protein